MDVKERMAVQSYDPLRKSILHLSKGEFMPAWGNLRKRVGHVRQLHTIKNRRKKAGRVKRTNDTGIGKR